MFIAFVVAPSVSIGQTYADDQNLYSNQDTLTETRRSTHTRECFGHYDRDGANAMNEQYVQGNLQNDEQCGPAGSRRWACTTSTHLPSHPEMGKCKANFNFLMTWNDGGGGGSICPRTPWISTPCPTRQLPL